MYLSPIPVKGRSHFGSNFWDAFSAKLNRDVNFYSDLEYDHWILVETDSNIIKFCEQPLKIAGIYKGKKTESIFDMWLLWENGDNEFIEIKYSKDLSPDSNQYDRVMKQITLQKEWCINKGYKYTVKTEKDIRLNNIYLNNMKTILPYLRQNNKPSELEIHQVIKHINEAPLNIQHLEIFCTTLSKQRIKEIIFFLIYCKKIKSNVDEKILGYETEVWVDG